MGLNTVWIVVILAFLNASVNSDKLIKPTANEDEWWRSGVFYQIYPRSFMDSDGNGEGDIRGIINKLEHLKELGVTGTWLNPIFRSPMKDGGYDIADFMNVDGRYGSNEDLEELFKRAKELGIRIILDLVPNHTSDEHDWFKKSANREGKYENYYVWKDCTAEQVEGKWTITEYPNNWISVFHTRAWTYHSGRGQCYLHQFLAAQPDLNYNNPDVEADMLQNLLFWLDKGVDGFRIDAINHMFEIDTFADEALIAPGLDPTEYENLYHNHTRDLDESYQVIFRWRKAMDEYATEKGTDRKFMMTEAYAEYDEQVKWYGDENTPGSHMPFNFALIMDLNKESNAQDFHDATQAWYSRLPPNIGAEANWVLGNHDRPRIGYRYSEERHESLAMMTMFLPGINVVYYGEEILMTDNRAITWEETDDPNACQSNSSVYQQYTRDPVRTPFQWDDTPNAGFSTSETGTWLPIHENYKERNLKAQKEAEKSTFKSYQKWIALRKMDIFKYGDFRSMVLNDQVYGFARTHDVATNVVFVMNLKNDATNLNIWDALQEAGIASVSEGKVIATTSTSNMNIDDMVNLTEFELKGYDAVAFEVAGAMSVVASMFLMIFAVLVTML